MADPMLLLIGLLGLVGVLAAFRGGARAGSRVARHSWQVSHMGGVLVRALGCGAVIGGAQWLVLAHSTDPWVWAGVLGVPAVLAGAALARVFVVSTLAGHAVSPSRTGARR